MEIDDKWISGKKYLDMSEYLQWQEEQNKPMIKAILRIQISLLITEEFTH